MTDLNETGEKMNCGLSLAQRELLQARLGDLEETVPPRAVWQRIESQARAERLFRRHIGDGAKWLAGAAVAASVALVALNIQLTGTVTDAGDNSSATPPVSAAVDGTPTSLNALMVQSQRIERDLRALPVQPSLMRGSTAATIADLEDRIAAIDYVLNQPQAKLTPLEAEMYWRERIRLMNSLLNLRRAQAQRMAF